MSCVSRAAAAAAACCWLLMMMMEVEGPYDGADADAGFSVLITGRGFSAWPGRADSRPCTRDGEERSAAGSRWEMFVWTAWYDLLAWDMGWVLLVGPSVWMDGSIPQR